MRPEICNNRRMGEKRGEKGGRGEKERNKQRFNRLGRGQAMDPGDDLSVRDTARRSSEPFVCRTLQARTYNSLAKSVESPFFSSV
jgi:hypothetical protein